MNPPVEDQAHDPFDVGAFKPPTIEELDQQIPAYEFLEYIDRGGMGAVYRAKQRSLNRVVAVKLLPVSLRNRRVFAERFAREAKALALLNHPNIVSVYDSGEVAGGCLYYAMEYVKGTNLRRFMKEGNATARQLLNIVVQVCEAVQFAHSHGVVHRDVKPANILIDEAGRVKVADFGLAKVIGSSHHHLLTDASDALGTPDYMAPEAVTRDYEVDHRADIYSLGVMLYEMLTNHVPKGAWEPPSQAAGVDVRFDEVVRRALQTDPKRRYQSVGELSTEVRHLLSPDSGHGSSPALERQVPQAPATSDPKATTVAMRRPAPPPRRHYAAWGLITAVLVVAAAVFVDGRILLQQLMEGFATPAAAPLLAAPASSLALTAPAMPREQAQRALAQAVMEKGGFVNVNTTDPSAERMGEEHDIKTPSALPKGDFSVWRVCMADTTYFGDEDLASIARLCEQAGTVRNMNLNATEISPRGLEHLGRLSPTLTSLNLRETATFTPESLPLLARCRNLKLLKITTAAADPMNLEVSQDNALLREFRESLSGCEIIDQ